jgi:hypothetical protein
MITLINKKRLSEWSASLEPSKQNKIYKFMVSKQYYRHMEEVSSKPHYKGLKKYFDDFRIVYIGMISGREYNNTYQRIQQIMDDSTIHSSDLNPNEMYHLYKMFESS